MDFSKQQAAHYAADVAYSKWYEQLPDSRKQAFFNNGYRSVANRIRHQVRQENPFASEEEIKLRFIEITQAADYPPEKMAFIRRVMQKRIDADWKARFQRMRKTLGWSYDEMARFIGAASGNSLKASISRGLPNFAKLAVCVFEATQGGDGSNTEGHSGSQSA
jgi:hypothetical protein